MAAVYIDNAQGTLYVTRGGRIEVSEGGSVGRAGKPPSAVADVEALTGGESPTEAEFNALAAKLNAVLALLRDLGMLAG